MQINESISLKAEADRKEIGFQQLGVSCSFINLLLFFFCEQEKLVSTIKMSDWYKTDNVRFLVVYLYCKW